MDQNLNTSKRKKKRKTEKGKEGKGKKKGYIQGIFPGTRTILRDKVENTTGYSEDDNLNLMQLRVTP